MSERDAILQELTAVCAGPDETLDLAEAALLLARLDRPRVPLERYRREVADLVEAVTAEAVGAPPVPAARAHALARAIAGSHGFRGDDATYDDQQNANLMRVIDRRRGLPVALGILYIHCARAQGWEMAGLSFPGHFLVRLDGERELAILDPFHEGRILNAAELRERLKQVAGEDAELRPEFFAAVSPRAVLLRLQNNLKSRALAAGRTDRVAEVLESMTAIDPANMTLARDLGLARATAGNLFGAIAAFERGLALSIDPVERDELERLIAEARNRLN